jgi:putative ABC transport system permease protein
MMPAALIARIRALWRSLSRSSQLDAEMDEEMRFHVEMQAERLARERRLDGDEARRQAHVAFGGVEKWKEAGRDARGTQWIDATLLDCKLGLRMLIKHRSLTLVAAFSMAISIAVGALAFEVISEALTRTLPFEHGDRVISIEFATEQASVPQKAGLHELEQWRTALDSVEHLGAFRTAAYNLAFDNNYPEPIRAADISASAFAIAGTPALLGRHLLADDESDSAPPVVLIGFHEWQRRFRADPAIVGKIITLNTVAHTVIGVMPEGFAFPISHQYWVPLRERASTYQRREGPMLSVFGVLRSGVTAPVVEAQLAALHQPLAAQYPDVYGRLRPIVLPYTLEVVDIDRPIFVWGLRVIQLLLGALLVVVAINLAILFYARTVTRIGEISVRTALGASRSRILAQLFLEALVLSVMSAALGVAIADTALAWIRSIVRTGEMVPFWIPFELSAPAIIYAFVLAALAAIIVGVIPGLKTTGGSVDIHLRALTGGAGLRVGPMWTTLIVAQVAVAIAILPMALYIVSEVVGMELSGTGFGAESFVIAKVEGKQHGEITRRVEAEPGVAAVTFSSFVPGFESDRRIEFDDVAVRGRLGSEETSVTSVALNAFEVYDAAIIAGRAFAAGDLGAPIAIVNRSFAEQFFGRGDVLGQRFFFLRGGTAERIGPAVEIVGVVDDFPRFPSSPGARGVPIIYQPALPDTMAVAVMSIRFKESVPADVVGRLRAIGAEVDASVPLRDVEMLTTFYSRNRALWRFVSWALSLITVSVLLLSAAGIYALMSFTVAQRRREIGIRTALGGDPRRILAGIFGRVMKQLMIGLAIGSILSVPIWSSFDLSAAAALRLLAIVGAIIIIVGVMAAIGPARRTLRIHAVDALRSDG